MANANGDQDRQYHPIGYVRDNHLFNSSSSPIDTFNPFSLPNYYVDTQFDTIYDPPKYDSQSLVSSLSALNLSPLPSSSYPQQRQQSTFPADYFDGATPGYSNNGEFYSPYSYQTMEQSNYPFDSMINQNEGRRYMFSHGDQRNLPRENRFYQNDSSFYYNKNDQREDTLKSYSSNGSNRRIPFVYDFNQSDTGLGYNVLSAKPKSSNHQYRLARCMNLSLSDLKGDIMTYANDQYLCRILQEKFTNPSQEDIEMVVFEVTSHLEALMTNQYGNYFFQKVIDKSNDDQKTRILWSLCRHPYRLVFICQNQHGSRSVQALIDHIKAREHISLFMTALVPGTIELATGSMGHHVIQHCFKVFSNEDNEPLIRAMAEHGFQIATTRSGCVLLHSCIEKCQGQFKAIMLREILANSLHLSEDPFGNYVVQHILELKLPEVNDIILNQLKGNFFAFSRSKFASNVVQRCLSLTQPAQAERVIIELIGNPNVSVLLVDPYGNFVIQSAFTAAQGRMRTNLLNIIVQNLPIMRSNLYGKKIIQMLERRRIRLV